MCFSPINESDRRSFVDNYTKWQKNFAKMQMIPVIGMIGAAGVLALDAKSLIVNYLFTKNASLQEQIAKETYSRPPIPQHGDEGERKSSLYIRLWSVINLLTGSCIPIITTIFVAVITCCGVSCCLCCAAL